MATQSNKTSSTDSSSSVPKSPKSVRFQEDPPTPFQSFVDKLSVAHLLLAGGLFRFILILYGVYHDSSHALKYTDVDYYVFTDAASYILHPSTLAPGPLAGYIAEKWRIYLGSPYERATYRYTPLLAIFLLPNASLQPLFGKFLFSAADLGIALLQYRYLTSFSSSKNGTNVKKDKKQEERTAKLLVASIWIFNPFVANISTRGSSESILGFMILLFLHFLQQNKINASAVVFGLAVHFKIYPVIYASSVLAYLSRRGTLLNSHQVKFAIVSFGTFMLLNLAMFSIWGMPFVEHTYLYHLTRLDHRHNFSHYFYQIYLSSASAPASSYPTHTSSSHSNAIISVIHKISTSTFVPQLALSVGLGFLLIKSSESARTSLKALHRPNSPNMITSTNLPAIFFLQTIIFTTFNRVCTSQYFMWYLWFLPLAIPALNLNWKKGGPMLLAWIGGQAIWLSLAYRLEFLGESVYRELWAAGVGFFVVNAGIIWCLIDQLET